MIVWLSHGPQAPLRLMKRDSVTGRREAGTPRPCAADARLNLALLIQLSPQVEQAPEQLRAARHATSKHEPSSALDTCQKHTRPMLPGWLQSRFYFYSRKKKKKKIPNENRNLIKDTKSVLISSLLGCIMCFSMLSVLIHAGRHNYPETLVCKEMNVRDRCDGVSICL